MTLGQVNDHDHNSPYAVFGIDVGKIETFTQRDPPPLLREFGFVFHTFSRQRAPYIGRNLFSGGVAKHPPCGFAHDFIHRVAKPAFITMIDHPVAQIGT